MPSAYDSDWMPKEGWIVTFSTIPAILGKGQVLTFHGTGDGGSESVLKIAGVTWGTACRHDPLNDTVTVFIGTNSFLIERNATVKPKLKCQWTGSDPIDSGGSWTAEEGAGSHTSLPSLLKRLLLWLLKWLRWLR